MIALSSGSLYTYGMSRVFALATHAGYDGIELLVDHRWDTRDPAYIGHLSKEYKLPILAVHTPFVPAIQGWPSDLASQLRMTLKLAQTLGAPLVVVHLPFRIQGIVAQWYGDTIRRFLLPIPWPQRGTYYELFANNRLQELEAETGITIAVENMPSRKLAGRGLNVYWFNSAEQIKRFPHLTLDTTHLGTWGIDPLEFYGQLKENVRHVHLSNFNGLEHRLPQDGHLPLSQLLQQLKQDGYAGTVTVETDPSALRVESESECLEDLTQALIFCRQHLT